MRGYPLKGEKLSLPEGYTGVVMKEVRSGIADDDENERIFKASGQFKKMTYWNWDRNPSRADKYQQALDWIDISKSVR